MICFDNETESTLSQRIFYRVELNQIIDDLDPADLLIAEHFSLRCLLFEVLVAVAEGLDSDKGLTMAASDSYKYGLLFFLRRFKFVLESCISNRELVCQRSVSVIVTAVAASSHAHLGSGTGII